jgi:hypothetical protein
MMRQLLIDMLICAVTFALLAELAYVLAPFKPTRRQLPKAKHRLLAIGLIIATMGVLATLVTALPTSPQSTSSSSQLSPSQLSSIKITYPDHPISGEPDPQVPCKLTVRGSGIPPAGESLAVGEQHVADAQRSGDQEVDFESDVQQYQSSKTWSADITLGTRNTVGYRYRISVIVMRSDWESYIVTARNWGKPQDTWWPSTGPPAGARELDSTTVEQSSAAGC